MVVQWRHIQRYPENLSDSLLNFMKPSSLSPHIKVLLFCAAFKTREHTCAISNASRDWSHCAVETIHFIGPILQGLLSVVLPRKPRLAVRISFYIYASHETGKSQSPDLLRGNKYRLGVGVDKPLVSEFLPTSLRITLYSFQFW